MPSVRCGQTGRGIAGRRRPECRDGVAVRPLPVGATGAARIVTRWHRRVWSVDRRRRAAW